MSCPPTRLPVHAGARAREIRALCAELDSLCAENRRVAVEDKKLLDTVPTAMQASASNLMHYLALRRHDLRALQPRLSALGLSSLGRSEAQVLASLDAVRLALHALDSSESGTEPADAAPADGTELLAIHTQELLGPAPANRRVRIMVTAPAEAARDYALVHELLRAGMDCMRINCAHDDAETWSRMIGNLRQASSALGRACRIAMDLGGPKMRTGPLESGAAVMKIRPERDAHGRTTAPARVWLASSRGGRASPSPAAATLPVPGAWLKRIKVGDSIDFEDARGARRILHVVDTGGDGAWAELFKTSYIVPGTKLWRLKGRGQAAAVGKFAARENPIVLHTGDTLIINRNLKPGRPASIDGQGRVLTPACIGCILPEVFEDVRCGERIWFDDGKIGGVIDGIDREHVTVKIDRARARGEKLRGDKGINLPDSALRMNALTPKDIEDLKFVVQHADMVSLSFANSAADIELLQRHLERLGGEKLGVILKIETRRGFESLPEMLFAALRSTCCGVMIARGDLAVECGFERLAEVQEEILWLCEAAHLPVIWATQVLESLANEGFASRAEITDAAMSERAECVMLNKGAHVCQAVGVLDDILQRMQSHVTKKQSMLRELKVAERFLSRETH